MCRCDGRSTDAGVSVPRCTSRIRGSTILILLRCRRVIIVSLVHHRKSGADIFVKRLGSLFVFLQGHPEYDSESLLREYRRDVTRFLRGERPDFPAFPENYFDASLEGRLSSFAERVADGRSRQPHGELTSLLDGLHPARTWRASATGLYRNWMGRTLDTRVGTFSR